MKTTTLKVSGSAFATACILLLPAGVNAQTISTTGPDSTNVISSTNTQKCDVRNSNNVEVTNNNPQTADSGNVTVDENTTVGSVSSGDASNSSNTSVNVSVDNSGACAPEVAVQPTPTPVVMGPTTLTPQVSAPSAPAGGMGAEEQVVVPAGHQVLAPVGGVGAGAGGTNVLATIASVTIASALWFAARIRRQFAGLFG